MSLRTLLSLAVLAAVGVLLAGQVRTLLADPTVWPPDDYVQYWAAGRLNLDGQNPYSAELLLPLEKAAGRTSQATGEAGELDEAVMMWNPPWTLSVAMPLGSVPARVGQLVWLAVGLGCVGFATDRLWAVYAGRPEKRWVPWVIGFTFLPTLFALKAGQITPLVLLGAALFAMFARTRWYVVAGIVAVLMAIKPHLVYLLWPLVADDAVYRRDWRIVVGGIAVGVLASAGPLLMNPDVFSQYFAEMSHRPPAQWVSLTIGSLLRLAVGDAAFSWQFAPVPVGLVWAGVHWWRRRRTWNWADELPLIVLVSFVTAPYGAWHFDLVLMLLPLIAVAAGLSHEPAGRRTIVFVAAYIVMDIGMIGLNIAGVPSVAFAWVAPTILVLYAALRGSRRDQ